MLSRIRTVRDVVESSMFQLIVFGAIIVAAGLVGLETYPDIIDSHPLLFDVINAAILWIFTVEIVLRILAYGRQPWRFFMDGWNLFDFAIIVVLLMPLHSEFFAVLRLVRVVRLLRVVRTVRILRLIDLPQLQFIVNSLLRSLPSIGSIALLLSMHFYMYGVIGTVLFHDIDPVHFGTLPHSLLALFTTLTLEGWVNLMEAQMRVVDGSSVPEWIVAAYFVTFIVIGTMIVMNLIIGVIVNSMGETQEDDAEMAVLSKRGQRKLTIHQEISAIERQLEESTVCLRLLKKSLAAEAVDVDATIPELNYSHKFSVNDKTGR
ncbi:MAG TPA: ion transporter [Candidatus Peribacteria bacterium]|nr:ion transporter [Candidatus Peribacteria bacterium]